MKAYNAMRKIEKLFVKQNMKIITTREASEKWGISERRVQVLCSQGRIPGALKFGTVWVIPEEALKPSEDNQVVSRSDLYETGLHDRAKALLKKDIKQAIKRTDLLGLDPKHIRQVIQAELVYCLFSRLGQPDKFICLLVERAFGIKVSGLGNQFVGRSLKNLPFEALTNLISWSFEYLNSLFSPGKFSSTQFFTEEYMAKALIDKVDCGGLCFDPCCGGGNFLALVFRKKMNDSILRFSKEELRNAYDHIIGFDIDRNIIPVAYCNLVFEVCKYATENNLNVTLLDILSWPSHLYYPSLCDDAVGSLAYEGKVSRLFDQQTYDFERTFVRVDAVLTNPPFATIKGMDKRLSAFLKKAFPLCKCDLSAAFLFRSLDFITQNGEIGIVCQDTWMFLKTLSPFRKEFLKNCQIISINELGAGAFKDLSGEKSSVCLMVYKHAGDVLSEFEYSDVSKVPYVEKRRLTIETVGNALRVSQAAFSVDSTKALQSGQLKNLIDRLDGFPRYKEFGAAMQGTSAGNTSEYTGYFWEHFGDQKWIPISKGGGYARYVGLNQSAALWEAIKRHPKAVIRNEKYFPNTKLVFTDTGTSGLNVRLAPPNGAFIASGPGIRVLQGDTFAHLAFLNSRLPSFFLQVTTPKLTVAAGYINSIPFCKELAFSERLSELSKLIFQNKNSVLSCRPNQMEYRPQIKLYKGLTIRDSSIRLFVSDINSFLSQIESENEIDQIIFDTFEIPGSERMAVSLLLGFPVTMSLNSSANTFSINRLDSLMSSLLSSDCLCKKTKIDKKRYGADNLLEYLSRSISVPPALLAKYLVDNAPSFNRTLKKYDALVIQNAVLDSFDYSPEKGVTDYVVTEEAIKKKLSDVFLDYFSVSIKSIESIHNLIFCGRGFIKIQYE